VDVLVSLYPRWNPYLEYKKMKWIIGILIGISIGIPIGFSIYHYFFMDKFSCCGVFG
jgi:ABC-type nitrate/sulfonate/bicarbonate transport system permease component